MFTIKQQNKYIDDVLCTLGGLGLLTANTVFNFVPGANIVFMILSSITGGMLVTDLLSAKWQKIFENIGLVTKDNQIPRHIKNEETKNEIKRYFKLPTGLSYLHFSKAKPLLESALGRKIKIEQEGSYVIIKEYKRQTYESKWQDIFESCGFKNNNAESPKLLEVLDTAIGKRFIFKLPYGISFNDFERYKPIFETAFKKPLKLELTKDYKLIVQVYEVAYKSVYKLDKTLIQTDNMVFPLGASLETKGTVYSTIKFDRNNSHMLVCGMTGMGKTAFMRMLTTIAMLKNNTEVYISDLKATGSYNKFKKCRNLKKLVKSKTDTLKVLKDIVKIMNERYKILDKYDMSDQSEYNQKFKENPMSNIILIIEEFVILSKDSKANELLNLLLSQASGAGIYVWLTIQRPCAKTLDTRLKSNLSYTVAFKAKNSSNSSVYLDQGDFRAYTDLHEPGEALLLKNNGDIFFKSFFMNNAEIVNLVKGTYVDKKEDEVIEDIRIIPMPPVAKQISVLEKSKIIDLQNKENAKHKVVDLL